MSRFLTGIQNSGRPHLGNILGAILPAVRFAQQPDNDCFFFIADLHSLTSLKDSPQRIENTRAIAAAWMALGLDPSRTRLYRQSRVPQVCELMWYLSCIAPYPMLANAHSFKEKSAKLHQVNAGLFIYPVLMAADILLYDADYVPVGKDQKQHIEIARDLAAGFNTSFGDTLKLPEAEIRDETMTVPGTDGNKMSKSYGNIIDIFSPKDQLKKQVFSMVTDSLPLEASKDPDRDHVFSIYKLIAEEEQTTSMRQKYLAGGYGYGQAKAALYELILSKYDEARKMFDRHMSKPEEVEAALLRGEQEARAVASRVLERVRTRLGYDRS